MAKNNRIVETDVLLALAGSVLAFVLTVWLALVIDRPLYAVSSLLFGLSCLGYLVMKRHAPKAILPLQSQRKNHHGVRILLNIVFFLSFVLSIFFFCFRPEPYVRPFVYFVLLSFMVSMLSLEIMFLPSRNNFDYLGLLKIILIGINLEASELALFPSLVGNDPWAHQSFTSEILAIGHIPDGFGYSLIPFMHIDIASTSLVTGLQYKMATLLSISLPQVISNVLFVFLLGRFLLNSKIGLLGSLLMVVSNQHISMGFWTIPNTLGVVFALPLLYLLIKGKSNHRLNLLLAMFLMATMILTHTVATFSLLVLLFVFLSGLKGYHDTSGRKSSALTFSVLALFAVGAFSWWTFASGHITELAIVTRQIIGLDYSPIAVPQNVANYSINVPFSEQLFNNLGMILSFSISLVGCLYMISKQMRTSYRYMWSMGGIALSAICSLGLIFIPRQIIIQRWWYFSEVILALPLALAVFLFCLIVRNRLAKVTLVGTMVFFFSFLMILSPTANLDNSTFSPNTQIRYSFTKSELQAIDTVSVLWNRTIGVDTWYFTLEALHYRVQDISPQIYSLDFSGQSDLLFLIREEIAEHPFPLYYYTYKVPNDTRVLLSADIFSRVYDCSSVSAFYDSKGVGG